MAASKPDGLAVIGVFLQVEVLIKIDTIRG